MNKFSVSAICMDFMNIGRETRFLNSLGIKNIHLDIMDGNYVPRYGIMPEMCKRIADFTDAKMDAHLMVTDPEFAIDQFKDIPNIDTFTFHIDGNEKNAMRIIDKIRDIRDCRAGVAVNMATSFGPVYRLVNGGELDFVLFMGIHPGVLKQDARPGYLAHSIKYFLSGIPQCNVEIQVDGAVKFDTIPHLLQAGATNFVGGSSTIYKNTPVLDNEILSMKRFKAIENNWNKLKELLNV